MFKIFQDIWFLKTKLRNLQVTQRCLRHMTCSQMKGYSYLIPIVEPQNIACYISHMIC